jgi:hypothetical protein
MRDRDYDPGEERVYECYRCSERVTAPHHPGDCPDCGTQMRNRKTPIE